MSTEITTGDKPIYPDLWSAVRAAKDALQAAAVLAHDENLSGQEGLAHVPFLLQELGEAGGALTLKLIDALGAQVEAEKIVLFGTRTPMDPAHYDDVIRWPLASVAHDFKVVATNASRAWGGLANYTHVNRQSTPTEGTEA